MKPILSIAAMLAIASSAMAAPRNSFAVVVDNTSYSHCEQSIDAYCQAVREGGLDAFVASADWSCPEMLRDSLRHWYATRHLEGAVLVGDIPIPMVRRAQFLASAFKMDENWGEWRDNSVPSDRFYDDFDLKFDFIRRDSVETAFFYYKLSGEGAQTIESDIYTARIKPSSAWGDKYEELDNYFRKVVRVKAEQGNRLDRVSSYTGEGSFSNSMIAWVDETRTLGEQLPDIYDSADGARFFVFHQQPLMKDMLLKAACEDDSDMFLFHCHGTPDRQWIGGYITSADFEDPDFEPQSYEDLYLAQDKADAELIKYLARSQYTRLVRYGSDRKKALERIYNQYGLDSTWLAGVGTREMEQIDSSIETRCSILLDDVQRYDTDSRVVLFDACYNGDFREDDFIALRWIMGKGKTVVGLGNSVNVLQDKVAEPLLGMLSAGYNIGQWQMQCNILESHIIGDPTFSFASSYDFERPDISSRDADYWKSILAASYPADIKALALQKLSFIGDPEAMTLIHDSYCNSDSYVLRLQCLLLSLEYDSPLAVDVLVRGLEDPYEFVRRKAAYYLVLRGDASTLQPLVDCYFRDYNARRVAFNISLAPCMFEGKLFKECFDRSFAAQDFIYDRAAFDAKCQKWINSSYGMGEYMSKPTFDNDMTLRSRRSVVTSLRNMPIPYIADNLCSIVASPSQDRDFRVQCADILGWYRHAWNRAEIISKIESILPGIDEPEVRDELVKTVKRLKAYTR